MGAARPAKKAAKKAARKGEPRLQIVKGTVAEARKLVEQAVPAAKEKKAKGGKKGKADKAEKNAKPVRKQQRTKLAAPKEVDASTATYLRLLGEQKGDNNEFTFFGDELAHLAAVTEFIPTGLLALDKAFGGWPVGRVVEIAAWESVGKSTLIDQSIGYNQYTQAVVTALLETEMTRDIAYSRRLGLVPEQLIVSKLKSLQGVFTQAERLLDAHDFVCFTLEQRNAKPPPMLLAWDALGATASREELEGEADDKHVGVAARILRQNFRRLLMRVHEARTTFLIANHFYQNIGPFGGLSTYGGGAMRLYPSLRLFLSRKESIKLGEQIVGHEVEVQVKKTKICDPITKPIKLGLLYGAGFDNSYTLFDWGLETGRIVREGNQYVMAREGYRLERKFLGLGQLLRNDVELYGRWVREYRGENTAAA